MSTPRSLCWGPTPQAIVHLLLSHGHRVLWSKVKHTVAVLEHKNIPGCYVTMSPVLLWLLEVGFLNDSLGYTEVMWLCSDWLGDTQQTA